MSVCYIHIRYNGRPAVTGKALTIFLFTRDIMKYMSGKRYMAALIAAVMAAGTPAIAETVEPLK